MPVRIPPGCKSYNLVCAQNSDGEVLFGRKTRGFGEGQLVLPGGRTTDLGNLVVPVLDLLSYDASRELFEESGVELPLQRLRYAGALYVGEPLARMVTLHCCETDGQLPVDSDEVIDWAYYGELPYDEAPEDYKLWLPAVLVGKLIIARITETKQYIHELSQNPQI